MAVDHATDIRRTITGLVLAAIVVLALVLRGWTSASPAVSAPSPWAILTSPPPRCRLRTTRRGFSGSDNVKGLTQKPF